MRQGAILPSTALGTERSGVPSAGAVHAHGSVLRTPPCAFRSFTGSISLTGYACPPGQEQRVHLVLADKK